MVVKKTYSLTQEGLDELKKELESLLAERNKITESIKIAKEFGDLTENSEYQAARADQELNESRIDEIEHILQNYELIKLNNKSAKVQLGSRVTLKNEKNVVKELQIVGTVEADPLNGKISDESPIGKALMGKAKNDTVEVGPETERTVYSIVDIF